MTLPLVLHLLLLINVKYSIHIIQCIQITRLTIEISRTIIDRTSVKKKKVAKLVGECNHVL